MKKLVRGNAPVCLRRFKHGRDQWSVIHNNGLTDDVWGNINDMQHGYCAYCECKLLEDNTKRHIEHFIQRDSDPALTFDWGNIFGSCNSPNRCGKYKDTSSVAKKIDLRRVCKPDVQDPSDILLYLNTGKVRVKTELNEKDLEIAKNTILVFNLDGDSSLENSRKSAIAGEKKLADAYWQMLVEDTAGELTSLLEAELAQALIRIVNAEHSTTLRQLWQYNKSV